MPSQEQCVRIIISEHWASAHAGQLLASCLVNLLCRQVKVVRHIEVVAPEVQPVIGLPNGDTANAFPACLETMAHWAVNGAVTVSTTCTTAAADHAIFVGDFQPEFSRNDRRSLLTVGDGWRAWVGDVFHKNLPSRPRSANPLGPFLAASLAAGEIFKRSRGIRRGCFLSKNGYSLWSGGTSADWNALEDGPEVQTLELPPVHIVGAGAVGNAFAYVVANLGLSDAFVIPIDDDEYDTTNLNRCPLAGWGDLTRPKVESIARALRATRVSVFPFRGVIQRYVTDARVGLRNDIAAEIDDLMFGTVLSCVDKAKSRQDVQGLRPRVLLGGSTLDLQAKANLYSGKLGRACLGCFNPAEQDGERIRDLERQLRNMHLGERVSFLAENGLNVKAIEDYLSGAQCGGIGEIALKDFATRPPPEFSAGFVSLGAGLLLASALLRNTALRTMAPSRCDMTTLNFLNGGMADAYLGADDDCELKCQSRFVRERAR